MRLSFKPRSSHGMNSYQICFIDNLETLVSCKLDSNYHHFVTTDQQEIKHEDTE